MGHPVGAPGVIPTLICSFRKMSSNSEILSSVAASHLSQPYTYKGYTEHLAPSLPLQSLPGREEDWLPTGEYMKDLPRNLPTWGLKRPNQPISQGERHQMLLTAELINSCFATYPLED